MLNKILLHGRLTADPELRQVGTDSLSLCRFTVAVDRPYSKGETKADFIQCQAWRQTADFIARYFSKGKLIVVEGMLNNNDFTDKDGVKHYGYVVGVQNVSFGEGKNSSNGGQQGYLPPSDSKAVTLDDADLSEFEELDDGDVPF
jgi:single-strand DNA-binding protein